MTGSSTDFLFSEDLETILSLIVSDSFDESPESASMVTETSSEMPTEEFGAHLLWNAPKHSRLQQDCSVIFHQNTTKKIFMLLITRLSYPKVN